MEEYMLPCLNKQLFGIDCLGCGMQRATALLFKGEFILAFKMYPAIYTLILLVAFLISTLFFKFKYEKPIKFFLIGINIIIIIVSYFIKMNTIFHS
ncbi:MAG: DUF2752 domain-containing protein [Flavobacteriaceae bacterium]|nr:DUF2752 domain-containing protein [Flavobacteriaceae bacterium]